MELLQTTTAQFIPKCDGIVINCEGLVYYKVRWNYYKLRQLFNYKSRHGLLQSAMIITDCLSTVYSDTLQLKEEVDYISKYPEIDKGYFSHARQLTPRKCCLCRSQVYFQKRVTRASTFSDDELRPAPTSIERRVRIVFVWTAVLYTLPMWAGSDIT